MALIDCPECSTQVSTAAPSCPKCGYPIERAVATEDGPVLRDGGPVLGDKSWRDLPIASELEQEDQSRAASTATSATESRKVSLLSDRAKYILAALLAFGFLIWFAKSQSSRHSRPEPTSRERVDHAQPMQAPERDEQQPPERSQWERVCSNPVVRIQPAIAQTGLKIEVGYDRTRYDGRITDGTGPWGSYSGQCGTLVSRPELGEGLMVDVFLGPKDTDTGTPIRCKRVATAKEVVEHLVGYLQRRELPMDRPVSASVVCLSTKRKTTDSFAVFNHKTQRIEVENLLTGKWADHAIPMQAREREPEPEPPPSEPPKPKWYEGGTLHDANVSQWVSATGRNRIATCADLAAAFIQNDSSASLQRAYDAGVKLAGHDAGMRAAAAALCICMSDATKDLPRKAQSITVAEVAASCIILMDGQVR